MSVRITLDNKDHHKLPFQAGSNITGQVRVPLGSASIATQESIARVILWWSCTSKLNFEKRVWTLSNAQMLKHFPSDAILFRRKHVLTEREFVPAASRRGEDGGFLAFAFDIAVPVLAEPDFERLPSMGPCNAPLQSNLWPLDDPWPGSSELTFAPRLPESSSKAFFYTCSDTLQFGGSIDYILHAEVPDLKISAKVPWTKTASASESPTVVNLISNTTMAEASSWVSRQYEAKVRSPRLSDNHSHRLSIKERLTLAFANDAHVPNMSIYIKFMTRQVMFLDSREDEHLPFRILVSWPGHHERMTQQNVHLKRLRVSLVGHLAARTNPTQKVDYRPHSGDGRDERLLFDWKERFSREEILPDTPFDLGPRLGVTYGVLRSQPEKHSRTHTPMALVPSFRALNIVRDYSLIWQMTLECAGVDVVWKYGNEEQTGLPVVLERSFGVLDEDQELPAYEES